MSSDKTLVCKECNQEFVFTASEQDFYAEKGFTNLPGRCPTCRQARKGASHGRDSRGAAGRGGSRGERTMYDVVCARCGVQTQVPFQPKPDREVLCRDCFRSKTNNR
ncbi:MAG TPA: zinc-ribbon domain containing protein [Bacillota bacterium]|nr:zinc-ribbon domain containing protein [Bacillota bacterium]